MSYSIFYNSFSADIADQKWNNFDIVINDALEKKKKIEELREKKNNLNPYDIDEELIYNPKFRTEYEKKRAEIIKARYNVEKELQMLEGQSPVSQAGILYYIENQTAIESDIIIPDMIELDLLFGGKRASYHSALDPIIQIETTLRILFPELNLREDEELKKEDCIGLFKYLNELDTRFEIHKKELLKNEYLDISNENELIQWKDEVKSYLLALFLVIEEVADHNAQFFSWTDSVGYPENSALKDRAKKHIEELKTHPLMKIPVQNYGK